MIFDFNDKSKFPEPSPNPNASLEEHLLYLKKYLFDLPYPSGEKRGVHDVKHATRALLHTKGLPGILQQLKVGEEYISLLCDKELSRAILIAEYLHDSGREGDGSDEWEEDSGLTVYNYLTQVMGISKQKAKWCAEAVVNKDFRRNNKYFILEEKNGGAVAWKEVPIADVESKVEFQIPLRLATIIQYGDCFDIHRTLKDEIFDTTYLDLYNQYSKQFEELLPKLLIEERRLLELMGDGPTTIKPTLQSYYQTDDFFQRTTTLIAQRCPVMSRFCFSLPATQSSSQQDSILPLPPKNSIEEQMDNGILLFRGVVSGPAYYAESKGEKQNDKPKETLAEIETRMVTRPEGNPQRSTTELGHGSVVFSSVGGLIKPTLDRVTSVYIQDAGTGFQSKRNLESLTWFERQQRWTTLQRELRFGRGVGKVNEIEYNIDHFDAIGFTLDPTTHENFAGDNSPVHPSTAILKAIYFRQVYAKKTNSLPLPLYEFSNLQHWISERSYTEDDIIQLWEEACRHWITHELKNNRHYKINLWVLSLDELKVYITFNAKKMLLLTGAGKVILQSPDLNYSPELKARVDHAVQAVRTQLFKELYNPVKAQEVLTTVAAASDEALLSQSFWNSEAIRHVIFQLKTYNLLASQKERIVKLIHMYFRTIENNDMHTLWFHTQAIRGAIQLFKMALSWETEKNSIMRYIDEVVIPLYQEDINKDSKFPASQKKLILDLLELARECNSPELVKRLYNQYHSTMATLSSTKPFDIRECQQFYEFCKRNKQLTPANKKIYENLLASISLKKPYESRLTDSVHPFFADYVIEYEEIFDAYLEKGFVDLAQAKLSELLTAGHKNIQLRPLNSLLNFCYNKNLRIHLDQVFAIIEGITPLITTWVEGRGQVQTPLKLSHFLMFLVHTESMSEQQYSASQISVIRPKIEEIIAANPVSTWELAELERCLSINAKRDFLGPIVTTIKQTLVNHVSKIEDDAVFKHYYNFFESQNVSADELEMIKKRRAELNSSPKQPDKYIQTSTNFFPSAGSLSAFASSTIPVGGITPVCDV